jgi:hypothetical protein
MNMYCGCHWTLEEIEFVMNLAESTLVYLTEYI